VSDRGRVASGPGLPTTLARRFLQDSGQNDTYGHFASIKKCQPIKNLPAALATERLRFYFREVSQSRSESIHAE